MGRLSQRLALAAVLALALILTGCGGGEAVNKDELPVACGLASERGAARRVN